MLYCVETRRPVRGGRGSLAAHAGACAHRPGEGARPALVLMVHPNGVRECLASALGTQPSARARPRRHPKLSNPVMIRRHAETLQANQVLRSRASAWPPDKRAAREPALQGLTPPARRPRAAAARSVAVGRACACRARNGRRRPCGGWWWQQLRIISGWLPLIGGYVGFVLDALLAHPRVAASFGKQGLARLPRTRLPRAGCQGLYTTRYSVLSSLRRPCFPPLAEYDLLQSLNGCTKKASSLRRARATKKG